MGWCCVPGSTVTAFDAGVPGAFENAALDDASEDELDVALDEDESVPFDDPLDENASLAPDDAIDDDPDAPSLDATLDVTGLSFPPGLELPHATERAKRGPSGARRRGRIGPVISRSSAGRA
jgi:hypothetical protein